MSILFLGSIRSEFEIHDYEEALSRASMTRKHMVLVLNTHTLSAPSPPQGLYALLYLIYPPVRFLLAHTELIAKTSILIPSSPCLSK